MEHESTAAGKPGAQRTLIRDISFCGVANGANSCMVDVRDGKILRIRPMHYDWKYPAEDLGQWEMHARGKTFRPTTKSLIPPFSLAYKKRVQSPARIRFPLRRVDFDPHGERNIQNRGVSKSVRISWDEALDIVTGEMLRVREKYGPTAILHAADQHGENKVVHGPHGCGRKLLRLLGGFTLQCRQPDSWEGWCWGAKHVWGMEPVGQQVPQSNLVYDIVKNAELLLFWGCDQETTTWGWMGQLPSRLSFWFTELGIKQVYIAPDLNYAAAIHADRWIPILPNTDAALYLAIAYQWFTEGTYDKDYLATHAYGVDKFEAYVMGDADGVPKSPAWAASITGVPSRVMKALAREWASKRTTVAIGNGGPAIRGPYSSEPARLQVLCLAMQGLGRPGANQAKMEDWGFLDDFAQVGCPQPKMIPSLMAAYTGTTGGETNYAFVPKTLLPKAILEGRCEWWGNEYEMAPRENQFVHYEYPAEGCSRIHMVWTDSPCFTTCWNDGNSFVRAMRHPDIEFIFAQHPWLENDCLLADVILPVSTKLEEDDINADLYSGQSILVFPEERCVEPLGESFSDYEITCKIAERLGLLEEYTGGRSIDDLRRLGFETSGVRDLATRGVATQDTGAGGRDSGPDAGAELTWEQFVDRGYVVVPTDPEWEKVPAGLIDFYLDPEGHPLSTPTGRIEFYATGLAEHFPDDPERPPVPGWIASGETHQETQGTERAKKFPLLVMSNHPRWSVHAQHDDITWLREIETCKVTGPDGYQYQPLWIHPRDAAARGVKNGDVVTVYNERGAVLAGAYVTERIISGAVSMDHGAKFDPIVADALDRGGNINAIVPGNTTSKNAVGMVVSGFLAEVEKTDLDELRAKYPEAFSRPFHPDAGPNLEAWLEAGT
jgi:molybdopterin guanine dinucleotide-containing S/N-oxide reductase-like protein